LSFIASDVFSACIVLKVGTAELAAARFFFLAGTSIVFPHNEHGKSFMPTLEFPMRDARVRPLEDVV